MKKSDTCEHDYTRYFKAGRACFLCMLCGADITLDLLCFWRMKEVADE